MKTEDILNLDCRKEESKEIIQKALKKIKPLSKYSDEVPLEAIEKLIGVLTKKYSIRIQSINLSFVEENGSLYYSCSIKEDDEHQWLGNCYGITIYELLSKVAIKLYSDIKRLEISERT